MSEKLIPAWMFIAYVACLFIVFTSMFIVVSMPLAMLVVAVIEIMKGIL